MKKLLMLGAIAAVTLAITGCSCPIFGGDGCCKDGKKCEAKQDDKCCKDKKDAKCDAPAAPAAPAATTPAK